MMMNTNREKASKIEQKLLITKTSIVSGVDKTVGNSGGKNIIEVNSEYVKIKI